MAVGGMDDVDISPLQRTGWRCERDVRERALLVGVVMVVAAAPRSRAEEREEGEEGEELHRWEERGRGHEQSRRRPPCRVLYLVSRYQCEDVKYAKVDARRKRFACGR